MTFESYENNRLWISYDYGKTWELRDDPIDKCSYVVTNVEGVIYRTGWNGKYKSTDYAKTFVLTDERISREPGLKECEFFSIGGRNLIYTDDCFENQINITIDSIYSSNSLTNDIFRGGLPGEVYVTSWFTDRKFTVAFSVDTGYNFRMVHQGYTPFMSDRKAGDFYILHGKNWGETVLQDSWIGYCALCVEYYANYGETHVGTYCHEFPLDYAERKCAGVLDMEAEVVNNNNVSLSWNAPETETPPIAYRVYRKDKLLQELSQTTYIDEDIPDGAYVYLVHAVYADGCESLSYNIKRITIQTQGVVERDKEGGIVVYPNPTGGQLIIENGELRVENVEVFDLMGRKQKAEGRRQKAEKEMVIDISELASGMYFIRIQTENSVITKKVIKQ
jgi:hypothetical protein